MTVEAAVRDDELLIVRTFDAPVSLVFHLWEDREHRMRWWGPKGFSCTHMEADFRPGGAWRACIESEVHGANWHSGRFLEIERDRRIVFTFNWEHDSSLGDDTVVTVTFREEGGKTVQTFHQTGFPTVASRDNHVGGWSTLLDNQQAYVEALSKGEQP